MRKLYIVKNEREFDNIIRTGKCIKNKSFIIYYIVLFGVFYGSSYKWRKNFLR